MRVIGLGVESFQAVARSAKQICYLLLIALIVWLPIPLGSRMQWSIDFMLLVTFAILLMWLLANNFSRSKTALDRGTIRVILFFMVLWLTYQIFQVLPLPESVVKILSPVTYSLYHDAMSESEDFWAYGLSLDRNSSLQELLKYSAYVAMFLLTIVLVDSKRKLLTLAYVLFAVGSLEAVFGIYAMYADIYLIPKETLDGHRWVIGTFVNRNHFAAHIVMTMGIGFGLFFSQFHQRRPWTKLRYIMMNVTELLLRPSGWIFMCLVVLFSALLLSQSRGGIISLIGGFVIVMIAALRQKAWKQRGYTIIITFGLVAVLSAAWLGVGDLVSRFKTLGNDERLEQWRLTSHLIQDFPVFGVGGGNYRWVFANYREGTLRKLTYDHAHQDYMELLSEHGLVGALLLGTAFFLIIKTLFYSFNTQSHPLYRSILFGCLISMTAFLIHAFVDFNFRIPANAAYFYIISAMGLVSTTLYRKNGNTISYEDQ